MRLLLPLLLAAVVPAAAQAPAAVPARGVTDPVELEGFLDGVMTAFLRDKHIAGATVAVVKDGALLLAKGYGWADPERRVPVDPERTLFRIGSVSKLFTWTAVMQLVEQGRLDLDADVNTYLDFEVPDTYPEPITLRHILTHTPGLEEDSRDLFTTDSAAMAPMGEWLPAHMPARVRPPGTFSAYSNWATALAGYIVERVSGQGYDDYLEQHVFGPLGMARTTARQPLPGRFAADMSGGFRWADGRFEPKEWEIVTGAGPAGSMSASASDMAKFMIAFLSGGALGEARILSSGTVARMHAREFAHDERLPGFGLGFYEKSSHGVRIVGHGGDTRWFHTDLALFPSEGLGVFMSTNTSTGGEVSFGPFLQTFLDHYYPRGPRPALALARDDVARFAGAYTWNRLSYTTWQKAAGLASSISVAAADSGALMVSLGIGSPMRMVPVDSLLFEDPVSGALVAFRADAQGSVTHAFVSLAPMMAMEKQSGLANPRLHLAVLAGALALYLGILLAVAVRWLNRKAWTHVVLDEVRRGRRLMAIVALTQLVFVVGLAALASGGDSLLSGPWTTLKAALALPVAGLVLTLVAGWRFLILWKEGIGTGGARFRLAASVVVSLAWFLVLNHWNLLGWRM